MYQPDNRWQLQHKVDMSLDFEERMRRCPSIQKILEEDESQEKLFYDGLLLPDMEKALQRIFLAMERREAICIYGDYDVDGICSASLLELAFRKKGMAVGTYIPDRMEEGYGLHKEALGQLKEDGVDLVISVDCGITSIHEANFAKEIGLDLIITDHHKPKEGLPEAVAVVNPVLPFSLYPNPHLCGAGVAFKLAMLLLDQTPMMKESLEFVEIAALATVADIMPLTGENRALVRQGLSSLNGNLQNPGLGQLKKVCNIKEGSLTARTLGFQIAPRLNATGRIGHGKLGIELITSRDERRREEIAWQLDEMNQERQAIEKEIFEEAMAKIQQDDSYAKDKILVVGSEDWHPGVIGIVASRIAERHAKPTVILSFEGDRAKGSARSIPKFDLFQQISRCQDTLLKFGGHRQAAGVTLERDKVQLFRKQMNEVPQEELSENDLCKVWKIALPVKKSELKLENADKVARLEPFGMENPQPVFLLRGQKIYKPRLVGKERQHFIGELDNGVRLIAFRASEWKDFVEKSMSFDLIFYLEKNEYLGHTTLQLHVMDYKINENPIEAADCVNYIQQFKTSDFTQRLDLEEEDLSAKEDPFEDFSSDQSWLIASGSLLQYKKAINQRAYYGKGGKKKYDIEFIPNIALIKRKEYNRVVLYDPLLGISCYEKWRAQGVLVERCFSQETLAQEIAFLEKLYGVLKNSSPLQSEIVKALPFNKSISEVLRRFGTDLLTLMLVFILLQEQGVLSFQVNADRIQAENSNERSSQKMEPQRTLEEGLKEALKRLTNWHEKMQR